MAHFRDVFLQETNMKCKNSKRLSATSKFKNVDKIGRLVREYSECSSIQGLHFLTKENVNICGKIFWLLVVTIMLFLSVYGSHEGF